jgi:hypothetical protein
VARDAEIQAVIGRYCVGFPEQNADGVDLSLIRECLKLTPTERVRRNWEYRQRILRLQNSARRLR